ncbi:hypothetical protein [Undibacterium fentianense]|uniref:Quinate/shikimate 5-dehydrogenase/glutamyl-tRNA reductase domain-containing protein n=1 Tax=Undibacterium fentianense TaxID=2828728 RepID=A0A941IG46_9BURK|nr:hypothetical protein [Undibacterium fentianense]MBR7801421.1 hypothetical protein [Undibacterium fentianense]
MFATLLVTLWRWTLALLDWRCHWRVICGRPTIDVVIITNVRDPQEKHLFWGKWAPKHGHSNGARIYLHGVAGRVRGIYSTAEELLTKSGRQLAKQQFIQAVKWADRRGAKVVLLAASTKRLFGRDGAELKALFPHMLFTIGDNGTALLLCQDIMNALNKAQLTTESRILVIGPYGILGTEVTKYLLKQGFDVAGFGTNPTLLHEFSSNFPIQLSSNIEDFGKVDAVIACTHSTQAKLNAKSIEQLRRTDRKLLVIDVAEPANLDATTYAQCQHAVVRQDAGNAWSPELGFVLGKISSDMLNLAPNSVFGCFAESMALYHAIYRQHQHTLLNQNWFQVNRLNSAILSYNFEHLDVMAAPAYCFGEKVFDFSLEGHPNKRGADAPPSLANVESKHGRYATT